MMEVELKNEEAELTVTQDSENELLKLKAEDSDIINAVMLDRSECVEEKTDSNDVHEQQTETEAVASEQFVIVSSDNTIHLQNQKIITAVTTAVALNADGSETGSEILEQPTKFIRLQGENGQTFMLAVAENSSGLISQLKLATTDDVIKSPERKQGKAGKSNSTDDITQAWFTTRDDKNTLQNNGHTWKQGQWTKEEVDMLKKNIERYCCEREIQDATEIIFHMSKDERKDFYRTIAKGLERPLFSVYRRVTRMYDQKNHVGRYTPEEMDKLRDLRVTHGNDWTTIGTALGRSASSVKDKCRLMKDKCNSGKWLVEEEKRLTAAVYELAQVKPGEKVTQGLSWASVAANVGSRSEKQCRTKWLNYLNWKEVGGTEWTRQDDINLILRLCDLGMDNESQIDWPALTEGWPSARSPQWLRGKWWSLKRHVPDYQNQSFTYVVNYLKSVYLQSMKVKAGNSNNDGDLDVTFSVPINLQSATCADDIRTTIEVLQEWPSDGALVIAHPNTTAGGLTFAGSALPSDHIIVQTLPFHIDKSNENVTNHPHIIVSADSTDDESVVRESYCSMNIQSLGLPAGLKAEQDLNSLSQNRDLDDQCDITSGSLDSSVVKYEVLTSEVSFDSQTVTDSGLPSEGVQTDIGHNEQSDIVHSEGESSNLDW